MSTFNHTNTAATGGQMLATDVTGPDNALDAAVGDLTTLTTTAKTSTVAALLEMLAAGWVTATRLATDAVTTIKIQAGAVTTAKLAASAVTANELASNAVTTAKILDANITAAKVSTAAFAFPNIVPDPFNRRTPIIAQEHGALLWYPRTQATLDAAFLVVANDAANPYGGGNTLRFLSTSAFAGVGKLVDCRRMGLKAGDQVTFAMSFMSAVAGGNNNAIQAICTDATGITTIGSLVSNGSFVAATGAEQVLKTAPLTIQAGTVYVRVIYARQAAGQPDGNIYAMWGNKGATVSDYPVQGDMTDYLDELNTARQSYGSLDDRLSATTGLVAGRNYMQSHDQKVAENKLATVGSKYRVMMLGDSWVQNAMIRPVLRAALQTLYGNGGIGWIDAASAVQSGTNDDGYTWARVGTWATDVDINTSVLAVGPNGADASTTDVATPAKLSVTYTAETAIIHYWKQPNGGDFEWQTTYNGAASGWTTVATANGTEIHGSTTVTTPGIAFPTLLEIRAKVAGSAGIRLLGTEWIKTGINLVWYPLGHNVTTVAKWLSMDATKWQANITALAPDIVIIVLGTNDKTAAVVPATFTTDLGTLCTRLRAAMPLVDILFISPGNNGEASTYPMSSYDSAIRTAAAANRAGYISGYAHLDIHANNQTRLMTTGTDGRHLLAAGGRMVASEVTDFLRVGV